MQLLNTTSSLVRTSVVPFCVSTMTRLPYNIRGSMSHKFLRNIPPNEWVSAVAKAYPGDDEVKGMLGQVGKLMRMMDYYESKKLKRK